MAGCDQHLHCSFALPIPCFTPLPHLLASPSSMKGTWGDHHLYPLLGSLFICFPHLPLLPLYLLSVLLSYVLIPGDIPLLILCLMSQLLCSLVISNLPSPPFFSCLILPLQLSPLYSHVLPAILISDTSLCFSVFPPLLSPLQQKTGQSSLPVTFDKQIRLWCQQDTNHMPVQRCSNAIYTHYKALSCDYSGMLIKQLCEDRAGRVALSERAKRRDKTAA